MRDPEGSFGTRLHTTEVDQVSKQRVAEYWGASSCGEELYLANNSLEGYREQARIRYELEPHIQSFAEFEKWRGKSVLEVGVGLGADHQKFAEAGALLTGIDLTSRAVDHARNRLALFDLPSNISTADAERLPFADESFDLVYSWGVIHHSPDTRRAAQEILRVLKPGGEFRVMIYYKWSLVGLMLWARYGVFRLSLDEVYAKHLESPGTKAYTAAGARALFAGACGVRTSVVLSHGDLLESDAGKRHLTGLFGLAKRFWPRWLLRRAAKQFGLHLLISGRKPLDAG